MITITIKITITIGNTESTEFGRRSSLFRLLPGGGA
jgi:hypothetical protein